MKLLDKKIETICRELYTHVYETVSDIDNIEYAICDYKAKYENENVPDKALVWNKFTREMRVGGKDKHSWFKFEVEIPKTEKDFECVLSFKTSVSSEWDAENPQGLVYIDGKMVQGIDINHTELVMNEEGKYQVWVYFYSGMFEHLTEFIPSVKIIDKKIEKLYYDLLVPLEAARMLDRESKDYFDIINMLNEALTHLDIRVPKSPEFYKSIDVCIEFLDKNFYNGICGKSDVTVNCIGHTHIDVAWLWTLAQTREKAQRSFSTVIELMKQYPEYKFMSSQPQLYEYVKEAAPELYEEIKKAVKAGRWEVEGAMWLEADCNLTSGESLVRQIMFGKKFMKDEFGVESKVLWLPDVFGYSAAMPQILNKSGIDKFVTSKISWNETNKMPYDMFVWQGIDGSEIFTCFLTARDAKPFAESDLDDNNTTYNGYVRPSQVLGTWKRFQQKEFSDETIISFGWGDGGGGPTKDMLEQQRRLSYGIPGFPKTQIDFAGNYLDRVKDKFFANSKRLRRMPKWVGELYLELHRGTYTSVAKNKRNNRKSELSYQRVETLSVIDMLSGGTYPQDKINAGWKEILLNQFHDIIPGSSIHEVYEDSDIAYKRILSNAEDMQNEKFKAIMDSIDTDGGIFVYNPNGFETSGTAYIDGKTVYAENIPAFGYKVVSEIKDTNTITANESYIENKFFKVSFDNGKICSIYDKVNEREVIKTGRIANELQVFEDMPKWYDAWEITDFYKEKMYLVDELVSQTVICDGVRKGIRQVWKYLDSVIEQNIWLYEDIDRIDFETEIDWKQEHMLLKAAFPVDVNASEATYDIQFGSLKRPTHQNTSWDAARFEVCAHKWADISDNGYGVSILNDCKYGYNAEGSDLKITLLKCANYPNTEADREIHNFTYSLCTHKGGVYEEDTIKKAYELNQPLVAYRIDKNTGTNADTFSLVNCDKDNIIIETVKKAENSDDIIVRMYESKNMKTETKLNFGFEVKKVFLCDLMENTVSELEVVDNSVSMEIGNFEIVTLKIER